jgi:CheY-like chemotaxis protein
MNLKPHIRVLLVDDEPGVRTVFESVLQEAGYCVETAKNGHEGWDMIQNNQPWDVAIVDRAMPEMGGEELGRKIRETSPRTSLIMITGAPEAITEPLLFDAILAKPFLPAELLTCLSRALEGNSDRPLWSKLSSWLDHVTHQSHGSAS